MSLDESDQGAAPTAAHTTTAVVGRSDQTGSRLVGNVGVPKLVFTVLSYNAPLGVLAGVLPLVIGYGVGVGAPLLFLALGALMAVFAVGYNAMSRHLDNPAGFYAYVTAGLGRPLGLGASFVALASYTAAMVAFLIFTGLALESFVRDTLGGIDINWWVFTLAFVAAAGVLGYRRIDVSARVMAYLLTAEVAVVVVWDLVITSHGISHRSLSFQSFNPDSLSHGSVVVGVILAVTCFGGFEATAVFRDEVRDPYKTIPRATYVAIAIITLFYTVAAWVLIQGLGQSTAQAAILVNPTGAFFDTVLRFIGTIGSDVTTLLVVTSGFAALLAYHNVVSRYIFNLGSDGVLPSRLGVSHPRLGSPHRASVALTMTAFIAIVAITLTGSSAARLYSRMVGVAGYAFVILLTLAALGIACYLMRLRPDELTLWHWCLAPAGAAGFMGWVAITSTAKIDLLTGSATMSVIAVMVAFGSIALGTFYALLLKARRPNIFRQIGRQAGF